LNSYALVLAAGLLGAAGAQASTIDLTDNGSYVAGTSQASGTVDDIAWVIKPTPKKGVLTYTPFDGDDINAMPSGLAYENDGIGIKDDEVTYPSEKLAMTFAEQVTVTGVYVLDLFGLETASIYADGNLVGVITAASLSGDNSTDGYAFIDFGKGILATTLTFVPGSQNDAYGHPDFALAAVTLAPIPVPAAGLMLLGGLGVLGAAKRRRKTA
jgi:hypothetical protein